MCQEFPERRRDSPEQVKLCGGAWDSTRFLWPRSRRRSPPLGLYFLKRGPRNWSLTEWEVVRSLCACLHPPASCFFEFCFRVPRRRNPYYASVRCFRPTTPRPKSECVPRSPKRYSFIGYQVASHLT